MYKWAKCRLAGARALARLLNAFELGPENAVSVNVDLEAALIKKRVQNKYALASILAKKDDTFACLFLDVPLGKGLAEKLTA